MALLSLPRWPAGKVMLTIFWDERGVILEHYIPWGNTLTSTTCADLLVNHLRPAMKSKRNGFLSDGVRLQHGNAWLYTARTTTATIKDLHFLYLPMFASPRPKWFPPVWNDPKNHWEEDFQSRWRGTASGAWVVTYVTKNIFFLQESTQFIGADGLVWDAIMT